MTIEGTYDIPRGVGIDAESHGSKSPISGVALPLERGAITLVSGRRVEVEARAEGDALEVRAPTGEVVLSVLLTEAGPVLRFQSAALELSATRQVSIACDRFDVRAQKGVTITTDGDLIESVGGRAAREVAGPASCEALEMSLVARRGSLGLKANDDVALNGERIRLNCDPQPIPRTWEEFISRVHEVEGSER